MNEAAIARERNSESYRLALTRAFGDLENDNAARRPASEDDAGFMASFARTEHFEVEVHSKLMQMNASLASGSMKLADLSKTRAGETPGVVYSFRRNKLGACALAGDLVPKADLGTCVQFEVRPLEKAVGRRGQYLRLFLNPEMRAYGISYHEYRPDTDDFSKIRRLVKWDPEEPLSGEMLELSRDAVPLDLPVHASNLISRSAMTYTFSRGSRAGQTCQARRFQYKNAYGSRVTASWCLGDPWPAEVETNSYHAYLTRVN